MRYDDFRRTSDIDDRRDDSGGGGGGGGFGIPMGGGGLGIGTVIVLGLVGWAFGIDPRILIGGAEILTGGNQSPSYQTDRRPPPGKSGAPTDEMGSMISGMLGEIDDRWSEIFQASGTDLYRAAHRAVSQRHQWRAMRHGAVGDGAVLLSAGQADLSSTPRSSARSRPGSTAARATPANSPRPTSSRMRPAITSRTCSASCRASPACRSRPAARRKPTRCRSRSSCRPTASRASGSTAKRRSGRASSRRAISTPR